MEVTGKVHLIGQTETVGNNGFTKRQIVIATDEQYVQHIPIDFVKDKTSLLDNYKVGDSVKVSINVRGSEYQGKYYVNLQGWRIEKLENQKPIDGGSDFNSFVPANKEPDDLPF